MKNRVLNLKSISTLTITGLLLSACNLQYAKNPVDDLDQLRQNGRQENNTPPTGPKEIIREVPVIREKEVIREQTALSERFLSLKPESKMTFIEGKPITLKIRAKSNYPGVKIRLLAQGLPSGASLAADPQTLDLYHLTYTAPLYSVATGEDDKILNVTFHAEVVSVPPGDNVAVYQGMVRSQEVEIRIKRNNEAPSDLQIIGLSDSVNEKTETNFEIVVKVPGIDGQSPIKPRLDVFYDESSLSAGSDVQELSGALYVLLGLNSKDGEYLGDSKWKFRRVFDTKKIRVQIPRNARGEELLEASSLPVRVSFKVIAPNHTSTPEVLKRLRILLLTSVASPRWEVEAADPSKIELTPGQNLALNFSVQSGDPRATLQIDVPNIQTLPGVPTLTCRPSQASSTTQSCQLRWSVPCGTDPQVLTNEIKLSATAVSEGRNSEASELLIKTIPSSKTSPCSAIRTQRQNRPPGPAQTAPPARTAPTQTASSGQERK